MAVRFFVAILITGMMIGFSCSQKMKLSQSELIGRNLYVSGEQSSKLVEAKSHVQCLTSCHLAENCQSFVYGEFNCYHYGNIFNGNDLAEKDGYNYFIAKDCASFSTTTMECRTSTIAGTTPASASSSTTTILTSTEKEKTYTLYKTQLSWENAKEECENENGRLACIHDKETCDKLIKIIKDSNPKDDVWIGLEALSKKGPFKWTDGTEVSQNKSAGYFHNYLEKDPDLYDKEDDVAVRILYAENFVEDGRYEKWADCLKTEKHWYMCETP